MIKTIAFYEFLFTVKRKSYYLVTLGMPLIALAYFGLIALIVMASVPSQLEKLKQPVGMIDHSGLLTGEGGPLHGIDAGETLDIEVDDPTEIPELEDLPVPTDQMEFLRIHPVMYFEDLDEARASAKQLAEGEFPYLGVLFKKSHDYQRAQAAINGGRLN